MRMLALPALLLALMPPVPSSAAPREDLTQALEVLHAWDAAREEAWAASDPVALRALYVKRSGAGRADLRLLRDYAARGSSYAGS